MFGIERKGCVLDSSGNFIYECSVQCARCLWVGWVINKFVGDVIIVDMAVGS